MNDRTEIIEIEVGAELLEQVNRIIEPMGLTSERLIQLFFEWLVNPDTKEDAVAWLLNCKDALYE